LEEQAHPEEPRLQAVAAPCTAAGRTGSAISNLEEPPPVVPTNVVVRAARELFGLQALKVQPLPGERDRNFRLFAVDGGQFVLKVVHPAEDPAISEMQARLLEHLHERDIPTQTLVTPLEGRDPILRLGRSPTIACTVRCVTYLPGERLADVETAAARWRALGRFLARLDLALSDFIEPLADRPFLWDVKRADQLRPLVGHVQDPMRRRRVMSVLDMFADDVRPRLDFLRSQVIHNDGSPQNILVEADTPDRISGIIDYGDTVFAPVVQEVAVAIAYQSLGGSRPFGAAVEIARGFHEVMPLAEDELELIPALIATRLAVTTVITSWRSALHPDNATYIMRNDGVIAANLAVISALYSAMGRRQFVAAVLGDERGTGVLR
jgi:Ser/Thr protein kinase RdoA (MazF antagonist)